MTAPEPLAAIERPAIDGAQFLPINLCEAVSFNPRKRFDQAKLEDLAASVEKFGVMQPVLARPKANAKRGGALYEIVAGERRLRACKMVADRRQEGDIAVIPAIVRELTDFEARELATTENLQRDDLHPLEEAEGYEGLLLHPVTGGEFKPPRTVTVRYTVDELAARLGKSRGYVFARLKLLALVPAAREAFFDDKLTASVALMLARMPAKQQESALPRLLEGWGGEPYSARTASDFLHKNYMLALKSAVFDIGHVGLLPKAGSCHACPKRTGANPDLFEDVKGDDICTDPPCFEAKSKAHGEQVIEKARERGMQVITGQAVKKVMPYGEYSLSQTGHINLDKPDESLTGTRKNLRTLLGDDFTGAMLLKGEHMEQPMAVATEAEVKAALKAKGLLKPSTKSKPGQPAKALTADDVKKQRKHRVRTMMVERAPGHLWKHLGGLSNMTLSVPVYLRIIRAISYGLYELGLDQIIEAAGLHKAGTGALSPDEMDKLLAQQSESTLQHLMLMCLMSDHLENDTQEQGLEELAGELDWPVKQLLADVSDEVDSAIRDEIEALKQAIHKGKDKAAAKAPAARYRDPATLQTWSGRGLQPKWLKAALERGKTLASFEVNDAAAKTTSTPPNPAAAQGAKPGQKTPEQALAEAVAQEQAAQRANKKKTSQKDNTAKLSTSPVTAKKASTKAQKEADQKDKAATPPTKPAVQLSDTAAWPFPTGARY